MKEKLQRLNDYEWLLPKESRQGMNADCKLIANQAIYDLMEDEAITQLSNVSMLPGVVRPVVALPDAHIGYGLPMGAVGAFDEEEGVISSGCTGFDINCGVRLIKTNMTREEVTAKAKELVDELFHRVPSGVGSKGKLRVTEEQLNDVMTQGAKWALDNEYAVPEDLKHMEEEGCMQGADPSKVSATAKKRGIPQLGTLGAGNHYLEVQYIDEIEDIKIGKTFGLEEKNQAIIMLHCGSRGFGHEVASDYLKIHGQAAKKYNIKLPDPQLVCAPTTSNEGQDYFSAMKCAVNYAFCNRTVMTKWVRESFEHIFKRDWESMDMKVIYDVCHNICKLEEHIVDGKKKKLYVHRKGATRALPAGHPLVPNAYSDAGQPVLIGGSMGTASYVLVGKDKAKETFYSSCHGAGRAMSRNQAISQFNDGQIRRELLDKGIISKAASHEILSEEAPLAYKDVDEVIDSVHKAGISVKVARLKPIGVIKG
jgi:tRNA-splicing ligase RtcB (3'-phosphate/5'-hydroxy nucleic acid ligase)